ncbi:hypothetical protein MTO96_046166, partial [Rhipicephalus appendiculatus]
MREPISPEKRVAIGLHKLCSSAEDRTVANLFGVGRSTVNTVYREFCEVVVDVLQDDWIKMITEDEMQGTSVNSRLCVVSVKVSAHWMDATSPFRHRRRTPQTTTTIKA